jgi:ligand-binding sensor domain-containing protein
MQMSMNRKIVTLLVLGQLLFQYCTESEIPDLEKGTWKYFTKKNGLADNYVTTIFEDKNGTLWFGHSGYGISRYDGKTFTTITTANGLSSNEVYCILQDKAGYIVVGNRNGLNFLNGNTWYYLPYLQNVPVLSVAEDAQGTFWFGTNGYGIITLKNGAYAQMLDNSCLTCNTVQSIRIHSDNKIWFATTGGVKVYNGSFMTLYTTLNGLPNNEAYVLEEDAWKNMWIGTTGAGVVGRYHNNVFDKVSLSNGLTDAWIMSMEQGRPGELWLGTLQAGLIHYDGGVMRRIYKGLPDQSITALFKDKKGNLWIGTYKGGVAMYTPE